MFSQTDDLECLWTKWREMNSLKDFFVAHAYEYCHGLPSGSALIERRLDQAYEKLDKMEEDRKARIEQRVKETLNRKREETAEWPENWRGYATQHGASNTRIKNGCFPIIIYTYYIMIEPISITITVCSTFLLAYFARLAFQSKCDKVDCCGISIHRNTAEEAQTTTDMVIPR
ncbi:MAG: hypothetical protein P4L35_15135 [Ignavibacteriaceae bacterium]|nr:hypothetical protein [Ignavibacteriaceae bacterium]